MPDDFGAKWVAFLGRMILIAAGSEDEEESLVALRTGLVTVIGLLFVIPGLLRAMPKVGLLLAAPPTVENWLEQALPLALVLTVTLSMIRLLGLLYNVRCHYPRQVLLLPLGYGIGLEAVWRWSSYHSVIIAWGAVGLVLLLIPFFYPRVVLAENKLRKSLRRLRVVLGGPVNGYLTLACLISWGIWIPITFWSPAESKLAVLGYLGPPLAALALLLWGGAKGDVLRLGRQLLPIRLNGWWYPATLLLPPLLEVVALFIMRLLGVTLPKRLPSGSGSSASVPAIALELAGIALLIEVGWRGYLLPRLLQRSSPFRASLELGFWWGVWYLPLYWNPFSGYQSTPSLGYLPSLLAFSVIITWLYHRTHGSLLVCALYLFVTQFTGSLLQATPTGFGGAWYLFELLTVVLPAIGMLVLDRRWFFGATEPDLPVALAAAADGE